MNYFKEAKLRWRQGTPPWFEKTQKICGALVALGATTMGVSYPAKLSWLAIVGGVIFGAGTFGGAICQFVVTTAGIIIQPGESIENKTSEPIEVKPATDGVPAENAPPVNPQP